MGDAVGGVDSWTGAVGQDMHSFAPARSEDELDAIFFCEVSRPRAALVCYHEAGSRVQDCIVETETVCSTTGVDLMRPSALSGSL